ncbi:MAG: carbohydrate-binding protein, partial [Cellulosilyticaceae bacterium]
PLAYTKIFAGVAEEVIANEIKVLPIGTNDVTETTAYFEWEKLKDAKSYVIYRDGVRIGQTEALEYTDSQLKSGTTYYYVIESIDKDGKAIGKSKHFPITTKGKGADVPTPPTVVPSGTWQPGVDYTLGDTVTYDGKTYSCAMAHRALGDWQPPQTPALWTVLPGGKVDANGTVWDVQVQYKVTDIVTYNGQTYSCIQAHKSLPGWEPDKTPALWGPFKK